METLEALARRIDTTEDLRSIVRTMKALSAVSIRQYDQAVAALKDYARAVELGLQVVLRDQGPSPFGPPARGATGIAIVLGSDHGLCGRFNRQVVRFAQVTAQHEGLGHEEVIHLVAGARARAQLEAGGARRVEAFALPSSAAGLSGLARAMLLRVEALRAERDIGRVMVFHNRRAGRATAAPNSVGLLPLGPRWREDIAGREWPSHVLPTFTMAPAALLKALVGQYLFLVLFRAAAESAASEHATRLATMQAAERNIDEHLDDVRAAHRRRRQDSITEEMLDVLTGFEAMRSEPSAGGA